MAITYPETTSERDFRNLALWISNGMKIETTRADVHDK